MVMSPLKVSFSLKRPNHRMSGAIQDANKDYNVVVERIGTWDLIEEFLAYNVFHAQTRWKVSKASKPKEGVKKGMRILYLYLLISRN
jgi:hypothetical protein